MQDNQLQFPSSLPTGRLTGLCVWIMLLAVGSGGNELEPGTRGYGLTVMEGTRVDTFGVEILGWEHGGALPGRDRILVRLSGLGLEKTGIVLGMSGSPVYVGDRLIGAVAWGWSFANEPIGLLTPIADMLEVGLIDNRVDRKVVDFLGVLRGRIDHLGSELILAHAALLNTSNVGGNSVFCHTVYHP